MIRVVTGCEDEIDRRWADNLSRSAKTVGMPLEIVDVLTGRLSKPGIILDMMNRYPTDKVLWVDPDTTFHRPPVKLQGIGDEVAYRLSGSAAADPVVLVGVRGRRVVEAWREQDQLFPRELSGKNLADAVRTIRGTRVTYLDPAYCWHNRTMRKRFPTVQPVIECHLERRSP